MNVPKGQVKVAPHFSVGFGFQGAVRPGRDDRKIAYRSIAFCLAAQTLFDRPCWDGHVKKTLPHTKVRGYYPWVPDGTFEHYRIEKPDRLHPGHVPISLDRYALGQIARFIDIAPEMHGEIVSKQLERHDRENRR
jgi:hypothetical protein